MVAHPNYLLDAPAALGPAQAAAQAEIEELRHKAQEYLHYQLLRTCAKVYFTECSFVPLTIANSHHPLESNPDQQLPTGQQPEHLDQDPHSTIQR